MHPEAAQSPPSDLLRHAINALRDAINALEAFSDIRTGAPAPPIQIAERPVASALSTLREMVAGKAEAADWQIIGQERLRQFMTKGGRRSAAMLFYMMERPGVLIPQEELMKVLGTKSPDSKIIKVYICHLRNNIKSLGWSEELIETGRRSYGLRAEGFSRLLSLLEGDGQDRRI